jgi:hypothetical protein
VPTTEAGYAKLGVSILTPFSSRFCSLILI